MVTLSTGAMFTTTRHLFVIGVLALLASAPSFAAAAPSSSEATSDQGQGTESDDQAVAHQIELFRTAQVSLSRAIEIAERAHAGARTSDVSFDGGSPPVYRVRTFHDGQLWEHAVNAATGEIATDRLVSSLKELNAEDRTNIASLSGVEQQLSDAIRVAERATSGKAISGGLTRERGKLNFVVIVVSGLDLKQVILEPPRRKGH
ncbi:PepSY domain-containing protein [Bradyrhizobium sp. Ai1a-2]|uniref:PepSY domain-containing protein n=1 Tax=Bradyrhizobium sp. Ai1a-2 TaxID=196490 RepID=UPI00041E4164|nr:PepSY domain-containing protein [Bradyrhizobium sp. Ai1a-2]